MSARILECLSLSLMNSSVIWLSVSCTMTDGFGYFVVFCFFMIIIFWNVRGVGNPSKRRKIKDALIELHPDMFGIHESKLNVVDSCIIAQLCGWPDVGFAFSPSLEHVGGLIVC